MNKRKIKSVRIFKSFLIPETEEEFRETEEYVEHFTLYNENADIIETTKLGADGEMETKLYFIYDDKGNMIEETHYHEDEELFTERKRYLRNTNGNIITEEKHYLDGSIEKTEYQYDKNENLIKKTQYDEDTISEGHVEFAYDEKKRLLESSKFDESGNLVDKIHLIYDENDQIIQTQEEDQLNNVHLVSLNTYNENNEISESIVKDLKGRIFSKVQNSYDDQGKLEKRIIEDFREYPKIDIIYYHYDEQKQLIEEETQGPSEEIRRKISYEYDAEGNTLLSFHYDTELTQNTGMHYWKTRMEYEFFE